jgi:hypothetical protein
MPTKVDLTSLANVYTYIIICINKANLYVVHCHILLQLVAVTG